MIDGPVHQPPGPIVPSERLDRGSVVSGATRVQEHGSYDGNENLVSTSLCSSYSHMIDWSLVRTTRRRRLHATSR
jgi:hypothetical protein